MIKGSTAVKAFWKYGFHELGYKEAKFSTDEVMRLGEYAMERRTFSFKSQPKSKVDGGGRKIRHHLKTFFDWVAYSLGYV